MTGTPTGLPINITGQLVQSVPFDPAPVINAGDDRLADYLAMPTQQILDQLGLQHLPHGAVAPPASPGLPPNPGGQTAPFDPIGLIGPVTSALQTLGTGQFPDVDPTSMLNAITTAFSNTSGPLQQALAAVTPGWQGASSAAAAAKTGAALTNGAEVAAQASALSASLATAVADVAQAQARLIAIANEYLATFAALLPQLILLLPWAWAELFAAASRAVTNAAAVMTELQGSLAAQAGTVSAIGAPVAVTSAPQFGASVFGPLSSLLGGSTASATSPMSAMNTLSPLMSLAMAGISPAMSAASAAGSAGSPAAATGATAGTLVGDTDKDPDKDPKAAGAGGGASAAKPGGPAVSPAGGGGAGTSGALVSRVTAPLTAATETATTAVTAGPVRHAGAGVAMGGGGMMGAPLAGAGSATGGAHTPASYLTTSDQGGKVVKDLGTVAPPVIGEADPYNAPDIELRI